MVLGMEIGLISCDFLLDEDPARPLNFQPIFIIVIVISLLFVPVLVLYAFYF